MTTWAGPAVDPLQNAMRCLRAGQIVLLYDADGREEETDMVVLAEHATTEALGTMRQDAGGLVCTAIAPEHHLRLDLPFLSDLIQAAAARHPVLERLLPDDIRYDAAKPAFGLTINHRATYTGITDLDRSLTITELAALLADAQGRDEEVVRQEFGAMFRSPGHVPLLNGAPGGLAARQGHTELSIELARQAGATGVTVLCEMLDAKTGTALSRSGAEAYAREHGLAFLTGQDVVDAWKATSAPVTQMPVPSGPTSA